MAKWTTGLVPALQCPICGRKPKGCHAAWRYTSSANTVNGSCRPRGVKSVEIIVGKAKGADTLGEDWASQHGFTVTPFPANWDLHGKSAGMIRNREMAEYAAKSPDKMKLLVAFWNGSSAGTANMIQMATQFQIPVMIIPYKKS